MPAPRQEYYTEVRLAVPRRHEDAVCNYIIENIAQGVVLEDEEDAGTVGILFYVPPTIGEEYRRGLETYLRSILAPDESLPELRTRVVPNVEWVEAYKRTVRPQRIAGDVVVRPPWSDPLPGTTYDILLEPRMAFGTGTHETTRGCLAAIRRHFRSGMRFLDVGCGSGILSLLAAAMGAGYIKAVDCDPIAVDNCRENFRLNGVRSPFDILTGSLEQCRGDTPYDFVCANIIKTTILNMLPELVRLVRTDGLLVLSGLLGDDEPEIAAALVDLGQRRYSLERDNEWTTWLVHRE